MKDITKKEVKKIWITDTAIHIELLDGKTAAEKFQDYPSLRNATIEALEGFTVSVYGIHWKTLDEDLSFNGFFQKKKKKLTSELGKVFSALDQINISALARNLRISQPLMASYISGIKKPSLKRKKEIEKHLHQLGKELQEIEIK